MRMIFMDMKVYEKTRYQNIYRNKKNKNYVIMMSKPVKTSISKIDGKKILTIEEAIKIRDNVLIKRQKALETIHKEDFDTLWDKYINNCKYVRKFAYNTIIRKEKDYIKYLKGKISISVAKTDENFWSKFIDDLNTTLKEKNHIIKQLKAFFNWCVEENLLIENPIFKVSKYKVEIKEMKFWVPSEIKQFLKTLDVDINSNNDRLIKKAYRTKILTLINFSAGDRIGETRALTFDSFNKDKLTLKIFHSINYDRKSDDFLSSTKTYESERIISITSRLVDEVEKYKIFLENTLDKEIPANDLIFFNHDTNKPYCDTQLRKDFHYYCEKAGVSKIRMYDLRHTYAATMMAEGKSEYLFSKRMGHKNIMTTINKYGHLSSKVRKEVAQITDKYI